MTASTNNKFDWLKFRKWNLKPHGRMNRYIILVHSKYIHCIISFASFIVESGVKNHKNDKPPPLVVCEKIYLISFLGHLEVPPHGTSPTPQRKKINEKNSFSARLARNGELLS
jgi:hypothetical protein